MKKLFALLLTAGSAVLACAADSASEKPVASITLGARHAHVTPIRQGFNHTGGGNIDVQQPTPDVLIVTMSGVAVAGGHPCKNSCANLSFELNQCLDLANTGTGPVKITMEGRVIGALRSHSNGGSAQEGPGRAVIMTGSTPIADLTTPAHSVSCGDNLSVNCRTEPVTLMTTPGRLSLYQSWNTASTHPSAFFPCKAASAEFAPDPALDPLWISYWEPFHGAIKKDFGFQVILRVAPGNGNGK